MFRKAAFTLLGLIWLAGLGLAWPSEIGMMVFALAILTIPYLAIYSIVAWAIKRVRTARPL
jgi:hypothetical protein